jgi:2-polyprenyl-3-methyl-5-hydroxy-6-metoxy-1,4-benzoquinol methylase
MPSLLTPFLQKQRFAIIRPYLSGDILDLGCGLALISEMLEPGQRYVGVEGPSSFLDWLHTHRPEHSFYQRDLDVQPLALDQKFDTILMIAVIEHLEKPGFVLSQVPFHLKTNGRLVITTPSPIGDRIHQIGARVGLFSKEAMHEHETIFTKNSLKNLAGQKGLELILYRTFLLGGNQLFIFQAAGVHPG